MFTGIIEETGVIKNVRKDGASASLTIQGAVIFSDLKLGDSVAVNGVCLTVTSLTADTFISDVMRETLDRSSLGNLRVGSRVNLERAMHANGRFGGHFVSGHIDGTGVIKSIVSDGNAVIYKVDAPAKVLKYIVEKGSVAIDGISLTVMEVSHKDFCVSIIPHTLRNTILSERKTGDSVNLENDIIGKYVEKLMNTGSEQTSQSVVTEEFLLSHGF